MNEKTFKQELLNALYAPYKNCTLCPLGALGRTNVVFGEGNPDSDLMIIGEGPGADEDIQGRPFVGRSGKLLTKMLNTLGVEREERPDGAVVALQPLLLQLLLEALWSLRRLRGRRPPVLRSGECVRSLS